MYIGIKEISILARNGRPIPTAPDYEEPVGDDPVAPPGGDPVPPTTTPVDPETEEPEPGFDPDFVAADRIDIIDGQAAERTTNDPATFGTAYIASEVSAGEYWEFTVNAPTPKNATFAVGVTTLAMPLNGIPGERSTELAWWSDGTVRQNDTTLIDLGADGRLARGDRGAIAFGPSGEVRLFKNCSALNAGAAVGSLVTASKVYPFVALFSARTRVDMVFTLAKFGCPVPEGYYPIGQVPAPSPARYWRVSITENFGSGAYAGAAIVEMREEIAGPNVFLSANGTLIFSSQFNTSTRAAANAIDGDFSTRWINAAGASRALWIGMDFGIGGERIINEIAISNYSTALDYSAKSVLLQSSDDGVSWRNRVIGTQAASPATGTLASFSTPYTAGAVESAEWRINITARVLPASGFTGFSKLLLRSAIGGPHMMDANHEAAGAVTASSDFGGTTSDKDHVFEHNETSRWLTLGSELPAWIGMKSDAPFSVSEFIMWPDSIIDYTPADFQLQYKNGSGEWVTLQEYTGVTDWVVGVPKTFTVT